MATFTCITCQVGFHNGDDQREHFQKDWHRYNLKRKIANLPPLTAEEYVQRATAQQPQTTTASKNNYYCKSCKKKFCGVKSYENHILSKKHHQLEELGRKIGLSEETNGQNSTRQVEYDCKQEDDDSEVEEVDSDEWEEEGFPPVPANRCLFCPFETHDFDTKMNHMSVHHSFFIPDVEYCTDIEGLIMYLGEKIGSGMQCIWCNERSRLFDRLDAVQTHMRDKGHTKMKFEAESLLEYTPYFDYSSSYPDHDSASPDDDATEPLMLSGDAFELVLPSGAVIGHRSLLRYYRQSLKPESALAVSNTASKTRRPQLLSQYKALGWTGATVADVRRRARDIQFMRRVQAKHIVRLSSKANKLQHHFRNQNPI